MTPPTHFFAGIHHIQDDNFDVSFRQRRDDLRPNTTASSSHNDDLSIPVPCAVRHVVI